MRTIIYIDGYNLYYGALKHTKYKWLDLYKLFNKIICPSINSDIPDIKIKFFTADILGSLSPSPDSTKDLCEQVILCTNDTDLLPALSALSEDYPSIQKGIVFPVSESKKRPVSNKFKEYCDWTWKRLSNNDLYSSQLPEKIPTRKKPILKPDTW